MPFLLATFSLFYICQYDYKTGIKHLSELIFMKKILFVCHGNICRSPMAEFVMKHLLEQTGRTNEFEVASAAVSSEELGNDIYPPAKNKMTEKGIRFNKRAARKMTVSDYKYYDHIVCMDHSNLRLIKHIVADDPENKITLMMNWTNQNRDVADPWYTGDFEATYQDLSKACKAMINSL